MKPFVARPLSACCLALAALAPLPARAQAVVNPPPQNVLTLSAQATVEVAQDLLILTLGITRDGSDASAVQTQLRQVLDAGLAEARKAVRPGQIEVRTGQFSLSPRYTSKGGISGWMGVAELVIEGRDMTAISQLAGRVQGMTVSRVSFALSREARDRVEGDAASQAITRFRARADAYAKQFGFGGWGIREISVNHGDAPMHAPAPVYRARAMSVASGEEAQPIEPGKTQVVVTVNGSIQMSAR